MPHTPQPIEWDLFEWESWDTVDTGVFDYYAVSLKVGVGQRVVAYAGGVPVHAPEHPVGKTFSHAVLNIAESTITLYDTNDDEVGHKYGICLNIGEKLP